MLEDLVGHFTYAAVFALLVAGGVSVPVPEELVQLTAGYLARRGVLLLVPAAVVAWAGLVVGDFLLFRLGRSHGRGILGSRHVARVLTPRRRDFIDRHFARHLVLTIALTRHASGSACRSSPSPGRRGSGAPPSCLQTASRPSRRSRSWWARDGTSPATSRS